jgi:hypothetical protein
MKNPDDRTPAEWAEEARERRADAHGQTEGQCMNAWPLSVWDCEELAQRMDDLEQALRLLREVQVKSITTKWGCDTLALLARYEEDGR